MRKSFSSGVKLFIAALISWENKGGSRDFLSSSLCIWGQNTLCSGADHPLEEWREGVLHQAAGRAERCFFAVFEKVLFIGPKTCYSLDMEQTIPV
ncbi:hypothetical protein [Dysosmobacter sp.]|uniref:hypothetical protein n=1 Tax=Dysosmobacter sp. TaxID=2591382 RepID=UPI003AB4191A